ncbi:MAG: glycosyltransferase family 39 protein [Candidatus Krumholzibacteriia bacterium]
MAAGAAVQVFHHAPLLQTVENDFAGHAARAANWRAVFTLHGLYPFGYAFVLRLGTALLADPFLAARVIAVVSAGLSLRVAHGLARDLAGPGPALATQVYLALNWHFHETALLVGTDQLASLAALLAVRALASSLRETTLPRALAGGAWAGAAALVRQTALILLPAFLLAVIWGGLRRRDGRRRWLLAAVSVGAGLAVYAPQMVLSWRATGTPFHQTQARNVWFGMHGGMDWSRMPADREFSLSGLVREDPRLFFTHWAKETAVGGARLVAMTLGQFPPALARRVGGAAPIVCGALTGLAVLATLASLRPRRLRALVRRLAPPGDATLFLILLVGGWTAAVGLAFSTSRFLLTPWIVCAVAAVALFRNVCLPEDGGADRRAVLAQGAWLLTLLVNAGCVIACTFRLGV